MSSDERRNRPKPRDEGMHEKAGKFSSQKTVKTKNREDFQILAFKLHEYESKLNWEVNLSKLSRITKAWSSFATFVMILAGLCIPRPAQANWFGEAYDYWISGDLGMDMFEAVGIDEDELTQIVMDTEDSIEEFSEKVENTVKQINGDDCPPYGPTLFDDLRPITQELEFLWEYRHALVDGFAEGVVDEIVSGRSGDRLIAYGKGIGTGVWESGKETVFLVADGATYGYLVATSDGPSDDFTPASQIVAAYKNSDDAGEVTGQLLAGLVSLPGQLADGIINDKPQMVGEIVGSFIVPLKVGGQAIKVVKGAKVVKVAKSLPKASTVSIRVATHPKGLTIPGRVLGEYSAIKQGPLGKIAKNGSPADTLQATFSGYRYSRVKLNEPIVVHRFHNNGKGAGEFGAFWTLDKPRGAAAARIDSAVLPEWGNTMTHRTSVELPKGTIINVGEVGGQRGFFVGGGSQLVVENGMRAALKNGARVVERVQVLPSP